MQYRACRDQYAAVEKKSVGQGKDDRVAGGVEFPISLARKKQLVKQRKHSLEINGNGNADHGKGKQQRARHAKGKRLAEGTCRGEEPFLLQEL